MTLGLSLREIAAALGGEVMHDAVLCPGPGHSRRDRSLSVKLSPTSPDGFVVHSHADDDFRDCRDHVKALLGIVPDGWREPQQPRPPRPANPSTEQDLEARIRRATELWSEGQHPHGTVVERYLASRNLPLDDVSSIQAIRFHPACPWKDKETGMTLRVPAMLAAMRLVDGDRLVAVHRTRLSPNGEKLGRMMLGPAAGAAVKLDPDDTVSGSLTIGEGIETVMSGRLLGFRPAWALGSAGAIASFSVLPGIDHLSLLVERDAANATASEKCANRWHDAGLEVTFVEPLRGNDLNDAIMGEA